MKPSATALAVLLLCAFQQAVHFTGQKLADGLDSASAGLSAADIDGDGRFEIIAWSSNGVGVYRHGSPHPVECGLGGIRDVLSISPGDFNNDGWPDLAILTKADTEIWLNRGGRFEQLNLFIPEGAYNKAIWLDYDHDGHLDLFLLGDKSALLRNDGAGGLANLSNNFPFLAGRAVNGAVLHLDQKAGSNDLVVLYSDRPGAFYEDKLASRYEAHELNDIPAGARAVLPLSPTSLALMTSSGVSTLTDRNGTFEAGTKTPVPCCALAVLDAEKRGENDIAVSGAILRNGSGGFSTIPIPALNASALTAADFDGDGRTDLISVRPDGSLWFLRNR